MKKVKFFINNYPELLSIILGLSVLLGIGYYDGSVDIMIKLIFYIIIFGAVIGILSVLIKMFFK